MVSSSASLRWASRRSGLAILWMIWLLVPAVRRIEALSGGTPSANPLSLLPFVATGALALLELRRSSMSKAAWNVLAMAGLGFLIGAPMGLLADPLSFGFSAAAYLSALGAFALGWGDAREGGRPSLVKVLLFALPLLSVYGILQYFLPLTSWDTNWIETVKLASIGAPQEGHIRVFSSLNAPATFALVLAIGLLLSLGIRRRGITGLVSNLLIIVALALTYVRNAWVALVAGLLIYASSLRGREALKLVSIVIASFVVLLAVGSTNPTTRAFTERVTTFGNLNGDVSAQSRLSFTAEKFPYAVGQPLGVGLGQAGVAVKLGEAEPGEEGSFLATDNGYLANIFQVGPVGFLLVTFAMIRVVVAAGRGLGGRDGPERRAHGAVLAVLAALMVAHFGNDILYGVTGAIFWYLAGMAMSAEKDKGHVPWNWQGSTDSE